MRCFAEHYDELVALLATYGVRAAYAIGQTFGDRLQKVVADRMSEGIVDVRKAIQIERKNEYSFTASRSPADRLTDTVPEERSIGQPRQEIVLIEVIHWRPPRRAILREQL
jgi:predicted Rdx family selenoprotein